MSMTGAIVNGRVEFDVGDSIPDGTKVLIVREAFLNGTPMEPYILERELKILRERIEVSKTEPGMPLEEVLAKLDAEFEATIPARASR